VKSRGTDNPHNRFRAVAVEYDEGEAAPPSDVTLIDDHARSILSENDSPDLGFKFSANPYRGCQHACAYCSDGDTRILMADASTKPLAMIVIGDEIMGTRFEGDRRVQVRTRVVDHWRVEKPAYRVELAGGTTIITSGDHRLLGESGWGYVNPSDPAFRALRADESLIGLVQSRASDAHTLVEPASSLRVRSIEELGERALFDITTGTGDFIANGVVSHNCYARPTHEYLDLGAGTDFDTKIIVKRQAPELLRAAFEKPSWKGDTVMFSGVTDCYQPVERDLELTKRCLEVCLEYRNPVSVISKSALVERDIELFLALSKEARFHIAVSLAFTDNEMSRAIEPWAASPDRRFRVIETLAKAGVNVGVMCAPIIPGVNDNQLVTLLERAAAAGAQSAGWSLLRLPGVVKEVFEERVRVALPLAGDKILHRIRETRGGKLYDSRFHTRGRGEGPYAEMIASMFATTAKRLGLIGRGDEFSDDELPTTFRRPPAKTNQLSLF
jgi:DNA repair photolyase